MRDVSNFLRMFRRRTKFGVIVVVFVLSFCVSWSVAEKSDSLRNVSGDLGHLSVSVISTNFASLKNSTFKVPSNKKRISKSKVARKSNGTSTTSVKSTTVRLTTTTTELPPPLETPSITVSNKSRQVKVKTEVIPDQIMASSDHDFVNVAAAPPPPGFMRAQSYQQIGMGGDSGEVSMVAHDRHSNNHQTQKFPQNLEKFGVQDSLYKTGTTTGYSKVAQNNKRRQDIGWENYQRSYLDSPRLKTTFQNSGGYNNGGGDSYSFKSGSPPQPTSGGAYQFPGGNPPQASSSGVYQFPGGNAGFHEINPVSSSNSRRPSKSYSSSSYSTLVQNSPANGPGHISSLTAPAQNFRASSVGPSYTSPTSTNFDSWQPSSMYPNGAQRRHDPDTKKQKAQNKPEGISETQATSLQGFDVPSTEQGFGPNQQDHPNLENSQSNEGFLGSFKTGEIPQVDSDKENTPPGFGGESSPPNSQSVEGPPILDSPRASGLHQLAPLDGMGSEGQSVETVNSENNSLNDLPGPDEFNGFGGRVRNSERGSKPENTAERGPEGFNGFGGPSIEDGHQQINAENLLPGEPTQFVGFGTGGPSNEDASIPAGSSENTGPQGSSEGFHIKTNVNSQLSEPRDNPTRRKPSQYIRPSSIHTNDDDNNEPPSSVSSVEQSQGFTDFGGFRETIIKPSKNTPPHSELDSVTGPSPSFSRKKAKKQKNVSPTVRGKPDESSFPDTSFNEHPQHQSSQSFGFSDTSKNQQSNGPNSGFGGFPGGSFEQNPAQPNEFANFPVGNLDNPTQSNGLSGFPGNGLEQNPLQSNGFSGFQQGLQNAQPQGFGGEINGPSSAQPQGFGGFSGVNQGPAQTFPGNGPQNTHNTQDFVGFPAGNTEPNNGQPQGFGNFPDGNQGPLSTPPQGFDGFFPGSQGPANAPPQGFGGFPGGNQAPHSVPTQGFHTGNQGPTNSPPQQSGRLQGVNNGPYQGFGSFPGGNQGPHNTPQQGFSSFPGGSQSQPNSPQGFGNFPGGIQGISNVPQQGFGSSPGGQQQPNAPPQGFGNFPGGTQNQPNSPPQGFGNFPGGTQNQPNSPPQGFGNFPGGIQGPPKAPPQGFGIFPGGNQGQPNAPTQGFGTFPGGNQGQPNAPTQGFGSFSGANAPPQGFGTFPGGLHEQHNSPPQGFGSFQGINSRPHNAQPQGLVGKGLEHHPRPQNFNAGPVQNAPQNQQAQNAFGYLGNHYPSVQHPRTISQTSAFTGFPTPSQLPQSGSVESQSFENEPGHPVPHKPGFLGEGGTSAQLHPQQPFQGIQPQQHPQIPVHGSGFQNFGKFPGAHSDLVIKPQAAPHQQQGVQLINGFRSSQHDPNTIPHFHGLPQSSYSSSSASTEDADGSYSSENSIESSAGQSFVGFNGFQNGAPLQGQHFPHHTTGALNLAQHQPHQGVEGTPNIHAVAPQQQHHAPGIDGSGSIEAVPFNGGNQGINNSPGQNFAGIGPGNGGSFLGLGPISGSPPLGGSPPLNAPGNGAPHFGPALGAAPPLNAPFGNALPFGPAIGAAPQLGNAIGGPLQAPFGGPGFNGPEPESINIDGHDGPHHEVGHHPHSGHHPQSGPHPNSGHQFFASKPSKPGLLGSLLGGGHSLGFGLLKGGDDKHKDNFTIKQKLKYPIAKAIKTVIDLAHKILSFYAKFAIPKDHYVRVISFVGVYLLFAWLYKDNEHLFQPKCETWGWNGPDQFTFHAPARFVPAIPVDQHMQQEFLDLFRGLENCLDKKNEKDKKKRKKKNKKKDKNKDKSSSEEDDQAKRRSDDSEEDDKSMEANYGVELNFINDMCPKGQFFYSMSPYHIEAWTTLARMFVAQKTPADVLHLARSLLHSHNVNPKVWYLGLMAAAQERPDMSGFQLAHPLDAMPDLFVPGHLISDEMDRYRGILRQKRSPQLTVGSNVTETIKLKGDLGVPHHYINGTMILIEKGYATNANGTFDKDYKDPKLVLSKRQGEYSEEHEHDDDEFDEDDNDDDEDNRVDQNKKNPLGYGHGWIGDGYGKNKHYNNQNNWIVGVGGVGGVGGFAGGDKDKDKDGDGDDNKKEKGKGQKKGKGKGKKKDKKKKCIIVDGSVGLDNGIENKLWYWREDMMLNQHHWYWHEIYPVNATMHGDRRAELFFFMHRSMLARYNAERLSNGFAKAAELGFYPGGIIEEPYDAHLKDFNSGSWWTPRPAHLAITDILHAHDPDYARDIIINDVVGLYNRFALAIKLGKLITAEGKFLPIRFHEGLQPLANTMEATNLSVNPFYYDAFGLHNLGHLMVALVSDPDYSKHLPSGVMAEAAVSMRDPAFYTYHTVIDNLFEKFKKTLQPYKPYGSVWPLQWHGVDIAEVKVTSHGTPIHNQLTTFYVKHKFLLEPGVDRSLEKGIKKAEICAVHLDHSPFQFQITIDRKKCAKSKTGQGTVRLFMAPRYNEHGHRIPFLEQRRLMFQLDVFQVDLKVGRNVITRNSRDNALTKPWARSLRDYERGPDPSGAADYCGCGWPHHLFIPKGNTKGLAFDLFVMVTNFDEDIVSDHPIDLESPERCNSPYIFCGRPRRRYPDARPMGYPFDRPPHSVPVHHCGRGLTIKDLLCKITGKFFTRPVATLEEYVSGATNMAMTVLDITHIPKVLGKHYG